MGVHWGDRESENPNPFSLFMYMASQAHYFNALQYTEMLDRLNVETCVNTNGMIQEWCHCLYNHSSLEIIHCRLSAKVMPFKCSRVLFERQFFIMLELYMTARCFTVLYVDICDILSSHYTLYIVKFKSVLSRM